MENLIRSRELILENAFDYFSRIDGVTGLILSGSLADGSADCYSDIDLRVVIEDSCFCHIVNDREAAPLNWGEFLFHETIGPHWTVSYFNPFNKIDLFYYPTSEFKASPWYSQPIKILLDKENLIKTTIQNSKNLSFKSNNNQIDKLSHKAMATLHEIIKRVARGEYLYAHKMLTDFVETYLYIFDYSKELPPLGSTKFTKRKESKVKSLVQSLSFSKENQLSDLKILIQLFSIQLKRSQNKSLLKALEAATFQLNTLEKNKC